uniref:Uncharacterized protein n=1 Tax=Oryzias latipes TaxID=8090 RepID=A0A286P9W2_ORYLA|nr:hypothetical protein [Oryzias latipes]
MVNENYSFWWWYERNEWAAYTMVAAPLMVLGLVLIMHRFCKRPAGNIYKPNAQRVGAVYQPTTERQPSTLSNWRETVETCNCRGAERRVAESPEPAALSRSDQVLEVPIDEKYPSVL